MDIDQAHFRRQLLDILKHISNATFVTFDLEMSGISTRPKYGMGDRSHDIGKPTLQQQYEDMKRAAETFQVLQMGITCVEEDHEREYYLARPFNFNLSPLSADGVDIKLERTFSFSSSACDFLQKNRFDFGQVFKSGVPYLSKREEDETREEYMNRADRNSKIPDVVVSASDPVALEFYRNARKTINAWVNDPKPAYEFCNITSPEGPLNAYQRRLVHQLVRNEFPTLRTFARNDSHFMQVVKLDPAAEATFQKRKLDGFNRAIAKQVGLRWIFEALSGGDLSAIDPKWFCPEESEKPELQLNAVTKEFNEVCEALQNKKHIIVGHNLFTDLGFIYNTFIGLLPHNVKHFQQDIHELFPQIIDTKYLATHGHDSMNPRAGLKELLEPFKKVHTPLIVLHEKHTSYGSSFGKEHEAGFDSWMTAELFVKLSAKLYAEKKHLAEEDADSDTSSDLIDECSVDNELGGAPLNPPNINGTSNSSTSHLPPEWHARELNRFSLLDDLDDGSGDSGKEGDDTDDSSSPGVQHFIPSMKNKFWEIYSNKLRVNAAEVGVCDLNEGSY
ncbi:hypothetical protein G7Y89_g13293 [Cudoniella acicularis]|uniref:Poly(A)-specific ribonuclease PARN n=1 Tax=Cudoniella acicularis TaxID=354080 RepID=A0A8H4RB06_9HELO|nr:hypothetical protein G7Y89_g13293 [Cudoniella acicularis]